MTEDQHLSKASNHIQSLYRRYRKAILAFGSDITTNPTRVKYIGFVVVKATRKRRMANFWIGKQSFKIWFNVRPGTLHDPQRLTRQTNTGHTITIKDDQHFDYNVGLLRHTYVVNR